MLCPKVLLSQEVNRRADPRTTELLSQKSIVQSERFDNVVEHLLRMLPTPDMVEYKRSHISPQNFMSHACLWKQKSPSLLPNWRLIQSRLLVWSTDLSPNHYDLARFKPLQHPGELSIDIEKRFLDGSGEKVFKLKYKF